MLDRIVHRLIHRRAHGHAASTHPEGGHAGHDLHGDGRFAGEHAERYDRRARTRSRSYRRTAREVAALVPDGGHVLDVGTGPGRLLVEIARARPDAEVTGVDVEPAMVELAQRAARAEGLGERVRVEVANVAELPLEAFSVDAAVATLTVHHWPDADRAVRELVRVVRPGGSLLVVDFRSELDGRFRAALDAAAPGARVRRARRWMWGMPVLASWTVTLP